jgi:hypothetical protein
MLNQKQITEGEIDTADYILKLLIDDLKQKEQKLKSCDKAPKISQHVIVSKSALDKFYQKYHPIIEYLFHSVKYIYNIKYEFYGFKSWKIWLVRQD